MQIIFPANPHIYQPRFLFFFGAFSSGEFITSASSAASKAALAGFGLSQPDWPEAPFRTSSSMVLISSTPSGLDIVWFTRPRPKSERKQQNTTQRVYMWFWAKMLHKAIIKSLSAHICSSLVLICVRILGLAYSNNHGKTCYPSTTTTKVPELLCILTQDLSNLPGTASQRCRFCQMWFDTNLKKPPLDLHHLPEVSEIVETNMNHRGNQQK